MTCVIVDHSNSSTQRSLTNEERLKRRQEGLLKTAIDAVANQTRNLSDFGDGGNVTIRVTMREPTFSYDYGTGNPVFVVVGNDRLMVGDRIPKPAGSANGGMGGGGGQGNGSSEDDFTFTIRGDEWVNYLLSDLKLPNMQAKTLHIRQIESMQRAGFQPEGSPNQRDMKRTAVNALGRRLALHRPKRQEMLELEEQIAELAEAGTQPEVLAALQARLAKMASKRKIIPFIDRGDQRFRRTDVVHQPISAAVMFCLMDTSGSMQEHHKDLAKRFFWLLNRFLNQHYTDVDVVFIRHTDVPKEVPEADFFGSRESGGTVIQSALELMNQIIEERYPLHQWNIYGCQAGDGDAHTEDAVNSALYLTANVLPKLQYFAYLECKDKHTKGYKSALWEAYRGIKRPNHFAVAQVSEREQIFPVFRNLFRDTSQSIREVA